MNRWTFDDTTSYLEDLPRHPLLPVREVGLQRIKFMLDRLGNPYERLKVVHIAGSTGKGSTSAMIAEALSTAGYHAGLFRSPHLVSYRERIQIDRRDIGQTAWLNAFSRVWPVAEAMGTNAYPGYDLGRPSHGEVLLALALESYRCQDVEWAVLETGMGGRLDATNAVPSLVAVVTNVSLEHTAVLGSTVAAIAAEKAAIIKPGAIAITGADDPDALDVIRERARTVGAEVIDARRAVSVQPLTETLSGQEIRVHGRAWDFQTALSLVGAHQRRNAAVATAALEALTPSASRLDACAVARAFSSVRVPGRFEVLNGGSAVVLDGAQSTAGAESLRETLDSLLPATPITLLFAAMADKDVTRMARSLGPRARHIVLTRAPGAARPAGEAALRAAFEGYGESICWEPSVRAALALARQATASDEIIVVAGSLYLVGWVREALLRSEVTQ